MSELIYADLGETISNLQRLEALESRCQYAEAALKALKEKVRRYIVLQELYHSSFPFAEEYTELCNLNHDLRELCKK